MTWMKPIIIIFKILTNITGEKLFFREKYCNNESCDCDNESCDCNSNENLVNEQVIGSNIIVKNSLYKPSFTLIFDQV